MSGMKGVRGMCRGEGIGRQDGGKGGRNRERSFIFSL